MSVTATGGGLAAILAAIHELASKEVLVGIPASAPTRDDGPLNNATIGYLQENGSPSMNLPARPWLLPAIEGVQDQVADRLVRATNAALDGSVEGVDRQLHAAGMIAQNAVRAKINSGDFTPLSEATLAARRRRGRTGTKPLIDTAQFRNSATYVVRKQGDSDGAT